MIPPALAWTLSAWLALAAACQVLSLIALRDLLRRRPGMPCGGRPSATILVPIYHLGPRTELALERFAALGVPLICGVEDGGSSDGTAALLRRVTARGPGARLTLLAGPAPAGGNRKVANLVRMLPAARGEILILVDDDVTPPPGYLDAVLAPFDDPRVGLVTCACRAVPTAAWASRLDAVLTNTGFLPSVALAQRFEGVRFGLGATIAVRRSVLDDVGGLAPVLDRLADDHALASLVSAAGHRLVLAPVLLDHRVAHDRWRPLLRRQVRWARTIRAVRPAGYLGMGLLHGIVPALLLTASGGVGAAALPLWFAVRVGGQALVARRLGMRLGDVALVPLADLIACGVFAAGWLSRTVRWGGYRMRLGTRGFIRESVRLDGGAYVPIAPAGDRLVPAGRVERPT